MPSTTPAANRTSSAGRRVHHQSIRTPSPSGVSSRGRASARNGSHAKTTGAVIATAHTATATRQPHRTAMAGNKQKAREGTTRPGASRHRESDLSGEIAATHEAAAQDAAGRETGRQRNTGESRREKGNGCRPHKTKRGPSFLKP